MIVRLLLAFVTTSLAVAVNVQLGNQWVDEFDAVDAGKYVPPTQPITVVLFILSWLLATAVPALTASYIAHLLTAKRFPDYPHLTRKSLYRALREGDNPQMISGILTGIFAFFALMYLPGLFRL